MNLAKRPQIARTLLIAGVGFLVYLLLPAGCPEAAKRTAFIFVLSAAFWAFEIIPLYATAVTVVVLEIFLLGRPGGVLGMDAQDTAYFWCRFRAP